MKALFKRYAAFAVAALLFAVFILAFPLYRERAIAMMAYQARTMLMVIPPIFILLGLLDVWVPREKMMQFMGAGSGLRGSALAFLLGSFAAGPLYGAFPFAALLMRKGASLTNVLIFIGAWSTTKIPMFLFEMSALGPRFALSRLCIDVVGIALIALAIKALLGEKEIARMYERAEQLGEKQKG